MVVSESVYSLHHVLTNLFTFIIPVCTHMAEKRSNKRPHNSGQNSELTPQRKIQADFKTPPPAINIESNSKMEKQLQEILDIVKFIPEIRADVKGISETLVEHQRSIEFAQGSIDDLNKRMQESEARTNQVEQQASMYKLELDNCKAEINILKGQMVNQESYSRRENLLFLNIPEEKTERCNDVITQIIRKMGINEDIKFTRVHRVGKYRQGGTRAIIVRFHYAPHREMVWRSKSALKGTRTVIKEDYPEEIEKERRALFPVHNHARFLGKEAKMRRNSVMIDGQTFTTHNMGSLPEELQPRNICERTVSHEDKDFVLFFGKDSPFSNFFRTDFTLMGQKYSSIEKYYTYQKAVLARDEKCAADILATDDTRKIKMMGKTVKINPQFWKVRGVDVMAEGLKAKFGQNKTLQDILVATQGKILVECTRDKEWGCGHHLYAKEACVISKWEGENRLGNMLAQLRADLEEARG